MNTSARAAARSVEALDVLVVEDDRDSREILGMALEFHGACVRVAGSVQQALMEFGVRAPDVLVSDISMPGEDGYTLIRAIRDRERGTGAHTVAIAMTGFTSQRDHESARRAGFDEHVAKPVDVDVLFERIRVLAALRTA